MSRYRRWTTFSIRSLSVFCVIVAFLLAFWTHRLRTSYRIVREVRLLGGQFWNVAFDQGGRILSPRPDWLPTFLHPMVPIDVNYVYLPGENIGDAQIDVVVAFSNLRGLNISGSVITDDGLRKLQRCTNLQELQLYDVTTVSDNAIAKFCRAIPGCDVQR